MKYFSLVVVMSLSLAGCGEQGPGQPATPSSFQVPSVAKNRSFVKATPERPSTLPEALGSGGSCQVDWVNDVLLLQDVAPIKEKTKVRLVGWASGLKKGTSPQEVFITLVGPKAVYFKAFSGLKREDVSSAFKKPEMLNSGWEAYADLSEVSAGTYKVKVIQVDGPAASVCDTQRSVTIN